MASTFLVYFYTVLSNQLAWWLNWYFQTSRLPPKYNYIYYLDCVVIEFSWDDSDFPFDVSLDSMHLANKTQFQIHILADVFKNIPLSSIIIQTVNT